MRVLARRRNLDWTCPVEVEVAQGERQLLKLKSVQWRLILTNVEVSWKDTALVGGGWSHEEVKLSVASFVRISLR